MKKLLFIFLAYSLLTSCNADKENICLLKGKVFDTESTTLLIVKQYESGNDSKFIEIPIKEDGTFEYRLLSEFPEKYLLTFKEEFENGRPRSTMFLTDNDEIEFELYSTENSNKDKVTGGALNEMLKKYNDEKRKLFDVKLNPLYEKIQLSFTNNTFQSEPFKEYIKILNETENDSIKYLMGNKIDSLKRNNADLSKDTMIVNSQKDSILSNLNTWNQDYVLNNPSLFGYSIFIQDMKSYRGYSNIEYINKAYTILKEKFPYHPYTVIADNSIKAVNDLRIGGTIVDFTTLNANGKSIVLSNIVKKNKYTLVNLWAPWCGPCIKKNRLIAPIYKKYKADGFEVVSVVGQIEDVASFEKAVKKENYPWENFIEMNSENQIWEKYNISGNGGIMYLVDNTGKIVISEPTPKEIEGLLNNG